MATLAPAHDLHLHIDPDSDEYKEMERRIVRKQDWRIMPLICLSYLLSASTSSSSSTSPRRHDLTRSRARRLPRASFCDCRYLSCCDLRAARTQDRTNLGVARTLNSDKPGESLVETLNLKGLRYNILISVFFIPCTLPSTSLSPRRSEELTPSPLPPSFPPSRPTLSPFCRCSLRVSVQPGPQALHAVQVDRSDHGLVGCVLRSILLFSRRLVLMALLLRAGIVTICSAAVSNYAGLIAVRIALGIAEAGFLCVPSRSSPS